MIWAICILISICVVALLARVLLQEANITTSRDQAHILAEQYHELDNELSRDKISEAEYHQAKNELGRRILKEENTDFVAMPADKSRKTSLMILLICLATIPVISITLYTAIGNANQKAYPFLNRDIANVAAVDKEQLQLYMRNYPDDDVQRYRLMQLDAADGLFAETLTHFQYLWDGEVTNDNLHRAVEFGFLLTRANDDIVPKEAFDLYADILKLAPDNTPAHLFSARFHAANNDMMRAKTHWLYLVENNPDDQNLIDLIAQDIAKFER